MSDKEVNGNYGPGYTRGEEIAIASREASRGNKTKKLIIAGVSSALVIFTVVLGVLAGLLARRAAPSVSG